MAHQRQYIVENKEKYSGNPNNIFARSSWESALMKWLDHNPQVVKWSSEELVIPYICGTDGRPHRYFPDYLVELKNGKTFLIELKPASQTRPPKPPKSGRMTKSFKTAVDTWTKNVSKWEAAETFCKNNGITFAIWTEHSLKRLGIKIVA